MSQIKGKCILVAQEKGHITETLKKGIEYQFSKSYVEKISQHGYTIVNPADPANPIRMKEETFNLYFEEVDPNAKAKEEVAKEVLKEEPKAEEKKEDPDSTKSKEDYTIKPSTTLEKKIAVVGSEKRIPIFLGMETLIDNMEMIESITFTPQKDKNLMVTVRVKPDLDFSVTGVPEKIIAEIPQMLQELFSIKSKVKTLNELIDRRIELEKEKELEAKKAKTPPATSKKAAPTKKEEPKAEEKKEEPKGNTLFDQKGDSASKAKAEDAQPEPMDEGGDGIDANEEEDWG